MKKVLLSVAIAIICIAVIVGGIIGYLYMTNKPSVTFDFSKKNGEITTGASGFLYGFAEPDIPSVEIAKSIGVSTLSTKTLGGLQHPIGDVNQVADTFIKAGGKDIIVYTQDMYDTWYYEFDSMPEYLARVKETVTATEADGLKAVSEKLEVINLQLAQIKAARRKTLHWLLIALCAAIIIVFAVLAAMGSSYLGWDYSDPEAAVLGVGLHAFEWVFVRLAPALLLVSVIGFILTRKRS